MRAGLLAGPLSRPINSCISALGDWIDLGIRSSELFLWLLKFIDHFRRCGGLFQVECGLKHLKLWRYIFLQWRYSSQGTRFFAYRSRADKQIS